MRGFLMLGLAVVVLLSPGAVAIDSESSPDDSAYSCVFTNGYVVSVDPGTCAKAATTTVDWVESKIGTTDDA